MGSLDKFIRGFLKNKLQEFFQWLFQKILQKYIHELIQGFPLPFSFYISPEIPAGIIPKHSLTISIEMVDKVHPSIFQHIFLLLPVITTEMV